MDAGTVTPGAQMRGFGSPMIPSMPAPSSHPLKLVALVAPDNAGLDALLPAGDTLDTFGVGWETVLFPPCGAFPSLAPEWCVVVAASPDAQLPAALASGWGLPVVRVPVPAAGRSGLGLIVDAAGDLPAGRGENESFATVALGPAGAKNAALFAVAALAVTDPVLREKWHAFRARQTAVVLEAAPLTLEG